MVLKRFEIRLIILIFLSSLAGTAFLWSLQQEFLRFTSAGLMISWIVLIFITIHIAHRARRYLEKFALALKNQDPHLRFHVPARDPFFRKIHVLFNELISEFRLVRKEHQQEHQFFLHVMNHIGTGLLAYDHEGNIRLLNTAFLDLFGIKYLKNLSHLEAIRHDLPQKLSNMKIGDQSVFSLNKKGVTMQISVLTSAFKMEKQRITLSSFQDISREMDRTEVETWQKLIRVLTHEIMNSISPLRLLASGILQMLKEGTSYRKEIHLKGTRLENIISGLESIRKRSSGLNDFVESYRSLTRLPRPKMQMISVSGLFGEVYNLFEQDLKSKSIEWKTRVKPEGLLLMANEHLIVQVLVNLVKNALQALASKEKGFIFLTAYPEPSSLIMEINDDGQGIAADELDSIFTPFYTTRENGTGIGLSLAKQIMVVHNGSIQVRSEPGKGSTFQLIFRK